MILLYEAFFICLLVAFQCIEFGESSTDWIPDYLATMSLRDAAFVTVTRSENKSLEYEDQLKMFISTNDPLATGWPDCVYYVNSPGRKLFSHWSDSPIKYDCSAFSPNDIIYMPSNVVGVEGIVQTSGSFQPSKKDGQLQLYDTTIDPPKFLGNIAQYDSNEWAYNRVHWQDMDLDGDLDAVTARFHVPDAGETLMEFMWFENPEFGSVSAWFEHVISTEGPDIYFDTAFIAVGNRDYQVFVFAEFFSQRITLYWTEDEDNNWSLSDSIQSRVIDGNAGQPFDILIDDFNRDGILEFLVPVYDTDIAVGSVKVYIIPEDFRTNEFPSTVIADNFIPYIIDNNHMSPGSPATYYPNATYASEVASDGLPHKYWILLSGKDDLSLYVLVPSTDEREDWSYSNNWLTIIYNSTIGKATPADLDGDGYEELIYTAYNAGWVSLFSYTPLSME